MSNSGSSRLAGLERWRPGTRAAVYLIGLQPAIWTFYLGLNDQLGADPLKTLERTLGLWSLRFLVAGLAITPLRRLGGPNLVRYRRAIGLLAFFYALFHFSVYALLDQGLDLTAIWNDIVKKPFITVGMLALAILVPLAATSNNAMIKRIGGAAWQRFAGSTSLAGRRACTSPCWSSPGRQSRYSMRRQSRHCCSIGPRTSFSLPRTGRGGHEQRRHLCHHRDQTLLQDNDHVEMEGRSEARRIWQPRA
jgi:DMSO/TMAO reductase YedYZ heme-binding membrane subunit